MESNDIITRIEHIGVAVNDIEKAEDEYLKIGFKKLHDGILNDTIRGVKLSFLSMGDHKIELVSALEEGKPSVVDRYVNLRIGYCMYHTCYEVTDIEKAIAYFRSLKYAQIEEISIAHMMEGQREVYLYNKKMGLVELLEVV